ncbi:GTPase ObgE, partial [Mycoplasmopsis pullorum]
NKATPVEEQEDPEITIEYEPDYEISIPYRGHFEITGKKVEELYHKIPLNSYDNLLRFNNILKKIGVWDELIKNDIAPGDTVRIYGYEFQWEDEE